MLEEYYNKSLPDEEKKIINALCKTDELMKKIDGVLKV